MNNHLSPVSNTTRTFVTILPPVFTKTGTDDNASRLKFESIARLETVDEHHSIVHVRVPYYSDSDLDVKIEKAPSNTADMRHLVIQGAMNSKDVSKNKDAGSATKYPKGHPFHGCSGYTSISFEQRCELYKGVEAKRAVLRGGVLRIELEH